MPDSETANQSAITKIAGPEKTKTHRWRGGFSDQDSLAKTVLKARGWNDLTNEGDMLTWESRQAFRSAMRKERYMATRLTDETIRAIWKRLRKGDYQHKVAADFDLNQGRVSEINTGKRGGHITGMRLS
jgi:hypothetical protein